MVTRAVDVERRRDESTGELGSGFRAILFTRESPTERWSVRSIAEASTIAEAVAYVAADGAPESLFIAGGRVLDSGDALSLAEAAEAYMSGGAANLTEAWELLQAEAEHLAVADEAGR